jgi:beta-glucosidase
VEDSEGVFVGYRWYDRQGQRTLFPFGHGLSYTTFSYSGLRVTPGPEGLSVGLTVENTGTRTGQAVPQIYLGPSPEVRTAQQPVRALAGYRKVRLAPGESRSITVTVAKRQLQHWDSTAHGWVVGAGPRDVWAGPSAGDLPLRRRVTLPADPGREGR